MSCETIWFSICEALRMQEPDTHSDWLTVSTHPDHMPLNTPLFEADLNRLQVHTPVQTTSASVPLRDCMQCGGSSSRGPERRTDRQDCG
ncbi:unnamed protein product [Boreogadus saida]